jgi:hypothetical protein
MSTVVASHSTYHHNGADYAVVAIQPSEKQLQRGLEKGKYRMVDGVLERRCSRCHDYWPADSEFFFSNKGKSDGLNDYCKACYHEIRYPNGRPSTVMTEGARA